MSEGIETRITPEVEAFLRSLLADRMTRLTLPELSRLHRLHASAPHKGVPNIPADEVQISIDLCDRTIAKRSANNDR